MAAARDPGAIYDSGVADLRPIVEDLRAEHLALDELVAGLDEHGWSRDTPAPGWSVRDQISHLTFFDEQARQAVSDPDAFHERLSEIAGDIEGFMKPPLLKGQSMAPPELLTWWRDSREAMLQDFTTLDPKRRVPWYGPPMSPASFVTARLMETWAHGQDVADALDVTRPATNRLRHIAHLGVRARPNSYVARGLPVPEGEVWVELTGPDGDVWSWNESGAAGVKGSAMDFCLVVTQRRHLQDTDLVTEGEPAADWMSIAQAFAGPPGAGRTPGQFSRSGDG